MEIQRALYMIPVPISGGSITDVLPAGDLEIIKGIKHFIVENIRTSRRFLKKMDPSIDISQLTFYELNNHTSENEISSYLLALRNGAPMGVMSEAGCPGIADPGALVVRLAQEEGLRVIPLVGPSSIILSLMASGLNGQKFSFHGYLPVKDSEREKTIKELESLSHRFDTTQIFIETPYRNEKILGSLLKNLNGNTLLCVASNINDPFTEKIITKPVKKWKSEGMKLEKVPTIFLFYAKS